jgi:hypothetical protein
VASADVDPQELTGRGADYDAYQYTMAMVVYSVTRESGASYPVVSYWVDPVGSAFQ